MRDHGQDEYLHEAIEFLKEKNMEVPIEETPAPEPEPEPQPEAPPLPCGCPGTAVQDLRGEKTCATENSKTSARAESQLRQWPVQIMLVPPSAPYLKDADLLIAADCVPFSYANFHEDFIKDHIILVGCPKLDNLDYYTNKFTDMFKENDIHSLTYVKMEVPCCSGMATALESAMEAAGKKVPFKVITINIKGEIIDEK